MFKKILNQQSEFIKVQMTRIIVIQTLLLGFIGWFILAFPTTKKGKHHVKKFSSLGTNKPNSVNSEFTPVWAWEPNYLNNQSQFSVFIQNWT